MSLPHSIVTIHDDGGDDNYPMLQHSPLMMTELPVDNSSYDVMDIWKQHCCSGESDGSRNQNIYISFYAPSEMTNTPYMEYKTVISPSRVLLLLYTLLYNTPQYKKVTLHRQ